MILPKLILPKLDIGGVHIGFPVVQAALSGHSDWPMRVIARRLGASYTICQVLLDQFVVDLTRGRKAQRFMRVSDEEHPCGAQLMGSSAEQLAAAALTLVEAGFDVVDLNFACPVKKVLGRCRGGFLLTQPETALEIVARVRDVLPPEVPLTIKMRRGMDDSPKSRHDFFTILDGAFALGTAAVCVHGRTVRQRYEGRSRREFIREVKRHVGNRTVLGSGDLFTAKDCLDMIEQTGVDGVTVARGAIGNPWIFQQARDLAAGRQPQLPDLREQRRVIEEHFRLSAQLYGPARCCRQMRKFGIKYSQLHPKFEQVRFAFVAISDCRQLEELLDKWYGAQE